MDRLEELVRQLPYLDYVAIAVGAVLLLFGRKLYWLAVGGVGFFLGLHLAHRLDFASFYMELGVAVVAGIVCAFLAVVSMHVTIAAAGCVLGAALAYAGLQPFAEDLAITLWWLVFFGGVLGLCFAAFLFEAALIGVSSVVGAVLILGSVTFEPRYEQWGFLILLCVGVIVQSRQKRLKTTDD